MQNVCWYVGSDAYEEPVDWDAEALRQDAAAAAAAPAQETEEGNFYNRRCKQNEKLINLRAGLESKYR